MKRTKAPPLKRAAQNLILQRRKNKKKSQHEKAPRMITAYATEQKKSQQWLNSGEVLVITERRIEWQGKKPSPMFMFIFNAFEESRRPAGRGGCQAPASSTNLRISKMKKC